MPDYNLVIHQHVRYTATVEADSPEAAIEQVNSGLWDDTNNEVLSDRVRVYSAEDHLVGDSACSCSRHDDGSVTTMLCPVHADIDPCLTMAQVTGRRRKGTIRNGTCTSCGHKEA